jgi:phosphatidylglycerophosphatase A
LNFTARLLGSFFYTGFFPVAPATFASLVFVLIYALAPGGSWLVHPVVSLVTLAISFPVARRMEKMYGEDPSCVVLDEVVGMQVVLTGATGVGPWGLAAAFLLFRLFDIAKPFPVGRSQNIGGGAGVVLDDVLAGAYARVVMILVSLIFPAAGRFAVWWPRETG